MTKHIPRIISAVAGIALVGGGVYLIVSGHAEHGAGLIAGGLTTMALPSVLPPKAAPPADSEDAS